MRTFLRGKITLLFMTFALVLALPALAFADDLDNNLPNADGNDTVNAAVETTSVEKGQTKDVQIRIIPKNGDSVAGCNFNSAGDELRVSVASANTSIATVTPTTSTLTFTGCDDPATTSTVENAKTVTVKGESVGGPVNFTFSQVSTTTGATFDYNTARFSVSVTPDVTAPNTGITSGPAEGSTVNSSSATFEFNSNEANSTFETRLDNGAWVANGTTTSKTYNSLGDGSHTFDVRATDAAGNVDQSPASRSWTVQTDSTAPVITPNVVGTLGNNGWYTSNVSVSWTVTDPESAITSKSASCDTTTNINSDTTGQTVSCTATSAGGTDTKSVTIKRDATNPTITGDASPDANTNGWNNESVTVSYTCGDNLSGVASCASDDLLNTEGANQSASGTATDEAGNTASTTVSGINIDKTKPEINASAKTLPGGATYTGGWTNKDVEVSFSCADDLSGTDTNTVAGATKSASGADQSVTNTGTCTDKAGNTADSKTFSDIDIDKDKPVISASATTEPGGANYTAGTWTNKDVKVSFSCADDLSGTDTNTVAGATKSASGENQSVTNTGTCTDKAGNTADSKTFSDIDIDIDKDAPTGVTFQGGGLSDNASYDFGSVPAGPTGCTATDALSGFKSCGTDAATTYKTTVGTHIITATAEDNAGNKATKTLTYTVKPYTLNGFYQPVDMGGVVNTVKGGSTVPLKFEIFQSISDTEVTSTTGITLTATRTPCEPSSSLDPIEITATGGTSLRYDSTGGQFIYNWKTPTGTGCYTVTMAAADGSTLTAYFKMLK